MQLRAGGQHRRPAGAQAVGPAPGTGGSRGRRLSGPDGLHFLLALGLLLAAGRALGEICWRLNQAPVLGEIVAGILLGPTVLGRIAPGVVEDLFPASGPLAAAREGLATFVVTLFMFVAGLEVQLSTVWRRGKAALAVSLTGIVVPFSLGLAAALLWPAALGHETGTGADTFALFFAIALAISALPVIARILLDLNLYRTDLGTVVVASAVFDDLVGWIAFAVVLGVAGHGGHPAALTVMMTLGYAALMLSLGRWAIHRTLPWIQAHLSWPAGVVGAALCLACLGAALTEWIGVHGLFGAFMVGVALGDSTHLRERIRSLFERFVVAGLAPLFFATIGLGVDFYTNFDPLLVGLVFVIACAGKVLGCRAGARWAGMTPRESWAVGFGMNARGAMEIILGLTALRAGIIGERLFVALVVMALLTSVLSGPLMRRMLALHPARRLADRLVAGAFKSPLLGTTREDAILHLAGSMAGVLGLDAADVQRRVLARERSLATGLGHGVAVPHARIEGLGDVHVGVGISPYGLDFDAPDGEPAYVVCMVLSPARHDGEQLEVLAEVGRLFRRPGVLQRARTLRTAVELRALLRLDGQDLPE